MAPTIGRARFEVLLKAFSSMERAWHASPGALRAAGLDARAVGAITALKAKVDPDQEIARLEHLGIRTLTWEDPDYPVLLKQIYDLPPLLFIKGQLLPEDERSIAVVGTRRVTAYGREAAAYLTRDLAQRGVTIISGLARGVDAIAHRTALEAGGRTIAVLGHGLDHLYPPEHKALAEHIARQGALVSEYPLGVRPDAQNFPRRNRIMSGMSLGTLVIEAPEGSGAIWTVRHALEQDREVFCVPGSIFSPASLATNLLIQQGAKLVMSYKDVLEELNLADVAEKQLSLPIAALVEPADDAEAAILAHLAYEPTHIDDVSRISGLPMPAVSGTLALLELKGLVRQVGNMRYVRLRETVAPYGGTP
ncbi:MAG: DNA-protecting protein DprA [Chloroflexi bacterium]|nr:DNA-protecting protein DprA [Chloroflexota bacterium]